MITTERHILGRPAVYKLGIWGIGFLPRRLSYAVAERIADLSYIFYRRARETIKTNLTRVFPEADYPTISSLALKTFRNYSRYLVDYGRFSSIDMDSFSKEMPCVEGRENIDDALKRGRGLIVLTVHLGNWELGGIYFGRQDITINVVTFRDGIDKIDEIRQRYRSLHNINTIVLGDSPFSGLEILNALRRNEVVAMLVDRAAEGGVQVEFFGRPTRFPVGPLLLARETGAAIIPAFVIKENDGYRAFAEGSVYVGHDNVAGIGEVAQSIVNVFERYIRRYPEQWYNFVPV